MGDLKGRKALVTGGAQSIGAAIAAALAAAGADVVIGDIQDDVGRATAKELAAKGGRTGFVHLDVTKDKDWEAAIPEIIRQIGGLDIVVNNAGIEVTALVADIDADSMLRMFNINCVGTALGMKHAFRAMRPGGPAGNGGSVVNIASVAATIAFPAIAAYSGSKSAVDRMTRVAAVEAGKLGYGVRVNCVYPGLIANSMGVALANDIVALGLAPDVPTAVGGVVEQTPLGRLAEQPEVADAVVFLCSDAARFITGIGLPVDGGMGT
ncbi:MAG: SDR family oxidoreductase [Aquamicrobium sp.]|uniref:SDR family NAD(P)-dependent oxidoreductase n=2 Tax=Pseudomonadota TaxID=1224 RepID=UPI001011C356|nr:SDR family oxidoreductase [Mesorhizobium sp. Pch-S]MBR2689315.1 SDR family oxidoreductase [Aquamicrobium sp.]QAZ43054.1 oxidoreductase [Mesorhizobium sp. Pch-S]